MDGSFRFSEPNSRTRGPALPHRSQVRKALPALQFFDGKDIRPKKGAESAPTEAALRDAAAVAAVAGAPVAAAEEKSTVEFAVPAEREDIVHLRLELLSLTVGCGTGFSLFCNFDTFSLTSAHATEVQCFRAAVSARSRASPCSTHRHFSVSTTLTPGGFNPNAGTHTGRLGAQAAHGGAACGSGGGEEGQGQGRQNARHLPLRPCLLSCVYRPVALSHACTIVAGTTRAGRRRRSQ